MFVVKVGGSEGIDYDAFINDLSNHKNYVIVHGGSSELNQVSTKLGHPPKFVESVSGYTSRFTDRKTMDIFNMIYAGKMNKMIVEKMQQMNINAIGLSGIDGRLIEGKKKRSLKVIENGKKKILRGDMSGMIEKINHGLLQLLLNNGYIPVITPPAISYEGEAINVDGDRCAGQIAVSLKVDHLIILSNIPGLLKDPSQESTLIKNIKTKDIEYNIKNFAQGRMKKKLLGAQEAINGGVKKVILGDARIQNPISAALEGKGTVIE